MTEPIAAEIKNAVDNYVDAWLSKSVFGEEYRNAIGAAKAKVVDAIDRLASLAEPAPLSDAQIIEIRDSLLPSQGESFDCLAFARALEAQRGAK